MAAFVSITLVDLADTPGGVTPLSLAQGVAPPDEFTASTSIQTTEASSDARKWRSQAWEVVVIATDTDNPLRFLEGADNADPAGESALCRVLPPANAIVHWRCTGPGLYLNLMEFSLA